GGSSLSTCAFKPPRQAQQQNISKNDLIRLICSEVQQYLLRLVRSAKPNNYRHPVELIFKCPCFKTPCASPSTPYDQPAPAIEIVIYPLYKADISTTTRPIAPAQIILIEAGIRERLCRIKGQDCFQPYAKNADCCNSLPT
ncbi:MAG TPA: hypothetical protein VFR58_18720, partial [Flavisolibacter sp.]|nr:hypothetical protein [Flavisolibacter sp.]